MQPNDLENRVSLLMKEELPDVDFSMSEAMAESGLLDSLTMTRIIAALVMEFDVVIPYEEITRANFNSIKTMAALISKLQAE